MKVLLFCVFLCMSNMACAMASQGPKIINHTDVQIAFTIITQLQVGEKKIPLKRKDSVSALSVTFPFSTEPISSENSVRSTIAQNAAFLLNDLSENTAPPILNTSIEVEGISFFIDGSMNYIFSRTDDGSLKIESYEQLK